MNETDLRIEYLRLMQVARRNGETLLEMHIRVFREYEQAHWPAPKKPKFRHSTKSG